MYKIVQYIVIKRYFRLRSIFCLIDNITSETKETPENKRARANDTIDNHNTTVHTDISSLRVVPARRTLYITKSLLYTFKLKIEIRSNSTLALTPNGR